MNATMILGSIFSPWQLVGIIVISAVVGLLLVGNVVLYFYLRSHRKRKLCTQSLQSRREELLDHLRHISDDGTLISGGGLFADLNEPEPEEEDTDDDDEDDDEDEDKHSSDELGAGEDITLSEILAVADMSEYTRRKLGCEGDEYDNKCYYVRYRYGFEARLRTSSDEIKERYMKIITEFMLLKGVGIKSSFRGQRIYKGRKTLAQIFMRGKTLCIAFALDPKLYEDTKYRGIDKSDKKRFAKTPLMYKLTSVRRVEYARYLILQLAEFNLIGLNETVEMEPIDLETRTPDELFVAQAIHITILGEAPEEPELTFEGEDDEAAMAESARDERDRADLAIETPTGRIVFDRSFTARIIQASVALKTRYSELKNYVLSYKGVHSRISWKRESFSIGRTTLATFAVRGQTLMLYLAIDPARFEGTKYRVENMSDVASRRKTPLLFRIKGDRRMAYAKELIDILFRENGATRTERKPQDYTMPYESIDALVDRGLIKMTHTTVPVFPEKKAE